MQRTSKISDLNFYLKKHERWKEMSSKICERNNEKINEVETIEIINETTAGSLIKSMQSINS